MKFSMMYGTAWKKDKTKNLVSLALTQGFVAIDTANQAKHYNEPEVGEAIQDDFRKGKSRDSLFIQTKFTPIDGQDHRLPYDRHAPIAQQVAQSIDSSLKHLGVEFVDSFLLHGPYHYPKLGDEDWEAWGAIETVQKEGKALQIGVSNVNSTQLAQLIETSKIKPSVVQNRCFAQTGWDFHVRKLCETHGLTYQGFSLLTANPFVLQLPQVIAMAEQREVTPEQIIFAFSRQVGMLPLTGTSDSKHMTQDLASESIHLESQEVEFILTCGLNR